MDIYQDIEKLVDNFERDIGLAKELHSPNPQDTLSIKAAIVGFSYHAATDEWDEGHLTFLRGRLDSSFEGISPDDYGTNGENVELFYCLVIGFLLGLYQKDAIDDQAFRQVELQLAGFIMLHLSQITRKPLYVS